MVYLTLLFMGISLALLNDLASSLLAILHYSTVSVAVILLCNIAALMWLGRGLPWRSHYHQEKLPSRITMVLESLKLYGAVVVGLATNLSGLAFLQHTTEVNEHTLILLLFLVGIQLHNSGMTLKQIVLNRRGMIVIVVVVASSLIGSLINAFILSLPINTALAMAPGSGWHPLSGILLTESFGSVVGSVAFFSDLVCELIAITLIPGLTHRSRSTALGSCGVVSMDLTLPVFQRTGGLDMVSTTIVHGFISGLLVSILIAFLSA